jgi:hypothetical protein
MAWRTEGAWFGPKGPLDDVRPGSNPKRQKRNKVFGVTNPSTKPFDEESVPTRRPEDLKT